MGNIKQISLVALLIALGVVIAPFFWFPVLGSKAYPGQHMINAVAGVLLGPIWAAVIALFVGVIRMSMGIGTIFSIPGGLSGGVIVGLFHLFLKKIKHKHPELAALIEPMGTIFIGGTLAVYVFAPIAGREMFLIPVWIGWSFSCIPGAIFGFIILEILIKTGVFTLLKE